MGGESRPSSGMQALIGCHALKVASHAYRIVVLSNQWIKRKKNKRKKEYMKSEKEKWDKTGGRS